MGRKPKDRSNLRHKIVTFAEEVRSPYCPWQVTDKYIEFGSFREDSLKRVFQFCSALRLKFERSEEQVFFSTRHNFKIYFG